MKILTDSELRSKVSGRLFRLIGNTADNMGYPCYVIGGYVRDLFLDRPSHDIDFVVVGSGISMAKTLTHSLKSEFGLKPHLSVFDNFGTAQIKFPLPKRNGKSEEIELEFVGARKESYDRCSRKPIVENGTLEDDQNRRDFTINAMAISLNSSNYGSLIDPFDGIYDLEDGIIRTPLNPDITFSDDPLRMLRCIRFATQLNFMIADETFEALERNRERIKIISSERIIVELNKILLSRHPSKGIVDLERCGLLELILPEVDSLKGVETVNGRGHKDNFYHTMEVLENVVERQEKREAKDIGSDSSASPDISPSSDPLWLRWAAMLHDIGKSQSKHWDGKGWTFYNHDHIGKKLVPKIFRRLKLPLDERMSYVATLVGMHMRPQVIADEVVTDSAVRRLVSDSSPYTDDLMTLCEADITSKNLQKKARFLENFRMVREKIVDLEARDFVRMLQPVIDGNEIMEMFGLAPGPTIKLLKESMKNAIIDDGVPNTRDALLPILEAKYQSIKDV